MSDDKSSFAIFNYKEINWIKGTASAVPAQVGKTTKKTNQNQWSNSIIFQLGYVVRVILSIVERRIQ